MSSEEKTLVDVVRDIWRARIYIVLMVAVGLVAAAALVALSTPYYRASIIVSPASPMNGAEVSSLLADDSLFALRYLVQRVGVANSSDFLRFESMYNGPSVAALLLDDPNVEKGLRMDRAFAFSKVSEEELSPESLAEYVADKVALEPVGNTTLRRMVYLHPNRKFASYFIERLHVLSDALIRKTIREETEDRIRYLKNAVATTSNPEHRRALTTLLLEQERLRMLVSIEQPYAAAVVEPASSSVKPYWPDPFFLFSVFAIAGALMGFVIFSIREELAAKRKPRVATVSVRHPSWIKPQNLSNENTIKTSHGKTHHVSE
ncbi:MAG: hypothetical protein DHS20C02_19310 [Micavibrio sp.]|nr:MAG: hypothetical protein DHS20C02_19310 [Micavibrio sp.]